jgi:hypothetical protein
MPLVCCIFCYRQFIAGLFVQKLVITPAKRELGLAFKKNQKMIVEALEVNTIFMFSLALYNNMLMVHTAGRQPKWLFLSSRFFLLCFLSLCGH